jgi:hypothetical protein
VNADCCAQNCYQHICANPGCTTNGDQCFLGGECCTGNCVENLCAATNCIADTKSCNQNEDCCSDHCVGNKCAAPCTASGGACGLLGHPPCCTGMCNLVGTCP